MEPVVIDCLEEVDQRQLTDPTTITYRIKKSVSSDRLIEGRKEDTYEP